MIKTNMEKLIETAVAGQIAHPYVWNSPDLKVAYDGSAFVPVGFSGINFNVKVGDPAFDWAWGDHVEPGVAISTCCERSRTGLTMFSCIGNEATITDAKMEGKDVKLKGTTGVVTGKDGAGERVVVYFPKRVVEKLCVGDTIQIKATGAGLKLLDYPDVAIWNLGPRLLKAMNPSEKGAKVRVPVAKIIPGKLMGSGVGVTNPQAADYDIQCVSPETVKEYTLDALRLGDIVAVMDYDSTTGPRWQPGAITIGVIVHGASRLSGHGPGLNVILTSPRGTIEPIITRKANIAELMGLQ